MKQYRLKEEHPLKQKFNKLEEFMNKLQISVSWNGINMEVTDLKTGFAALLKDMEDDSSISQLPYNIESKLVIWK